MRFGAFIPQGWRHDLVGIDREQHWPTMTRVARAIESSGFESCWVYDHFHPVPEPTQEPVYEAWTLMASLAVATDTLRLGQMTTCNSYRPPAYLAKVAASIDVISGGRIEMSMGAGWYEHEYTGYGYEFPRPAVRIGMLRESVEIIRRLWSEDVVDYDGKYYTLQGARCQPKPLQDPRPPIWVAGAGEQLTLRIVARYADYSNFGGSVDQFRHKVDVLRGHCRDVGRDFDEIRLSKNFNVVIGRDQAEVDEKLSWYRAHFVALVGEERTEQMMHTNFTERGGVAGTPEQIVEAIRQYEDAGLEFTIAYFPEVAYDLSGLELFAQEVIPAFR